MLFLQKEKKNYGQVCHGFHDFNFKACFKEVTQISGLHIIFANG